MYEVLILSDSHGLTEEIIEIKNRHQLNYMIHCGDSELPYDTEELKGMYKVRGNCDFDVSYPNEELIEIGDLKIFVTHGHLFGVKNNLMNLSYRARELGANVICFGHSHIAGVEIVDNQLFINPGSIRMPRLRKEKSYAILRWNTRKEVNVEFYTVDGKAIKDMAYTASFN